jgi:hypothetical protein
MIGTNTHTHLNVAFVSLMFLLFFTLSASAQEKDSMSVQMNRNAFAQGDTINFEVTLKNYSKVGRTATIQLWIEEIKTGKRWKFRYPLINGYVNAKILVSDVVNNGQYALNFLLQKTFFQLSGNIKNATTNDKLINYVMISKNKQTLVDVMPLDNHQSFSLANLLFQDSAFIIFSKPKQKNNDLLVEIKTPLDSAFTPASTETRFITIGTADTVTRKDANTLSNYVFKADSTPYKMILPEIVIKTKMKRRVEEFETENVSGLFTSTDATILDGIESDEIAKAADLYTYLTMKMGGLNLETDNQTGNRTFTWRSKPTEIYINEIKLDSEIPITINPSDIALIKIFPPGVTVSSGSGAGGAIAIYTKTGEYGKTTNRNYSFYILGYTGLESTWK